MSKPIDDPQIQYLASQLTEEPTKLIEFMESAISLSIEVARATLLSTCAIHKQLDDFEHISETVRDKTRKYVTEHFHPTTFSSDEQRQEYMRRLALYVKVESEILLNERKNQ